MTPTPYPPVDASSQKHSADPLALLAYHPASSTSFPALSKRVSESYRKCSCQALFLGKWRTNKERELEVFLTPLGSLEAFIFKRSRGSLQEPLLLAQVSQEKIQGGLHGTFTSSLVSALRKTPRVFEAVLMHKKGEEHLFFLPRLSGAADRRDSFSTLELVKSKLSRLSNASITQETQSMVEDLHFAWENVHTMTQDLWPLLSGACSTFSHALFIHIEEEEKKLEESLALWDRVTLGLTENGSSSLPKERFLDLLCLFRAIFVQRNHPEQEKILRPLIDALERIRKEEIKLVLQGKKLLIPDDLVSWQVSKQQFTALYTLFAKKYAEVIQEKWDLVAKQFEQLMKLLASTLTARVLSGTGNHHSFLQETLPTHATVGGVVSDRVKQELRPLITQWMSALSFLEKGAFSPLSQENARSVNDLIDSALKRGIEQGEKALCRYEEFYSCSQATNAENSSPKGSLSEEFFSFLLNTPSTQEPAALKEWSSLQQVETLEPRLLTEDSLGKEKTLKFFKGYFERLQKKIESLGSQETIGVLLTCNQSAYALLIEQIEGKQRFFFFDPQGCERLNENDHAYIYYNEHLEYLREFLGRRILYHHSPNSSPAAKDRAPEKPNELRTYFFQMPKNQGLKEEAGPSQAVEKNLPEFMPQDFKGKVPSLESSLSSSLEDLLPFKERLLALLDTLRTSLMEKKKFDKAEAYLSLSLQFLEKTGSLEQQVDMLLQGGAFFLRGIEEKQASDLFPYYRNASNYYSAAYQLSQKGENLKEKELLAWKNLLRIEGLYLENHPHLFEKLTQFYRGKCGVDALNKEYREEAKKRQLIQEIVETADYFGARGCFLPAATFYRQACELMDKCRLDKKHLLKKEEVMKKLAAQKNPEREDLEEFHIILAQAKQDREFLRSLRKEKDAFVKHTLPYQVSSSTSLSMQKTMTDSYRAFLLKLFSRCALFFDPQKEHPYALIGVGSLVRKEFCPYSDFELAFLIEESSVQKGVEEKVKSLPFLQSFLEEVKLKLHNPLLSFEEAIKLLSQDYVTFQKTVEQIKNSHRTQGETFIESLKKQFPSQKTPKTLQRELSDTPTDTAFLASLVEKLEKQAVQEKITLQIAIEKRFKEYALFEKEYKEVLILQENPNFTNKKFFQSLAEFFDLTIRGLGETKWHMPGGKNLIPAGFSLDASNNLFHLCDTPERLALRQKKEEEDPVQLNVLRSTELLSGKTELFQLYQRRLQEVLDANKGYLRKKHACKGIRDYFKIDFSLLQNPALIDIKTDLLRFPVLSFEALCLYYGIDTSCHTIDKITLLCQRGIFIEELQNPFQEYLEFAFGLRWQTHLKAGKEEDSHFLQKVDAEKVLLAYTTLLKPLKESLVQWLEEPILQSGLPSPLAEGVQENPQPKTPLKNYTREEVFEHEGNFHLDNFSCITDSKLSPLFFAKSFLERAQLEIERGNFPIAEVYINKTIILQKSPYFLNYQSLFYFSQGEWERAEEVGKEGFTLVQKEFAFLFEKRKDLLAKKDKLPFLNQSLSELIEPQQTERELIEEKIDQVEKDLEACEEEKKSLTQLLFLITEQKEIIATFQEVFIALGVGEELQMLYPFAQKDAVFKKSSELLQEESAPTAFASLWRKAIQKWLKTILEKEDLREVLLQMLEFTYTKLPKHYRHEVKWQFASYFPDKLFLMQDFYCEEGYIFSAAAKREAFLGELQKFTKKERSEEELCLPSIQATYLSDSYFRDEVRKELFIGEEFKKTIDTGSRPVNETRNVFFKKNAESPGDEYAVFLLNHLITGQGSPPIELLYVSTLAKRHLLLASQKIEKEPLKEFLLKCPGALSGMDKKQYSQMVLMALLLDPEDGQDKNYIANYTIDSEGQIDDLKIIGIDNDHVFVTPFIQKTKLLGTKEELFIKTILFCFDQMHDSLHPEVKEAFLKLDPSSVLEEWLSGLANYNKRVEKFLSKEKLNNFWQDEEILIPFFISSHQVVYLHEKMARIQQELRKGDKTHLELLHLVNNKVGEFYAKELSLLKSPKDRFTALTPDAYRRVKGNSFTLASTAQIKQYTFKGRIQSMEEFSKKGFTPEDNLQIVIRLEEGQKAKESPFRLIGPSDKKRTKDVRTTLLQEELLKEKNWSQLSLEKLSEALKEFHGWPFLEVALRDCVALTDALLDSFIQSSRCPIREGIEIRKLNLQGCMSLTDSCVKSLSFCTLLKKLDLSRTNLQNLVLGKEMRHLQIVKLLDCKSLTVVELKGSLKRLSLEGCSALQKLTLDCPQLEALSLKGTPPSINYTSYKTPLSQALLIPFKKAQEESHVEIKAPLSDIVMEMFLRVFHNNHSLKALIIDTEKEKAPSSLKLPTKIDLSRHPSLESLQITCHSLEVLILEELPQLKSLRLVTRKPLQGAKKLGLYLATNPRLNELDLYGCSSLTASDLQGYNQYERLEELRLSLALLDYRDPANHSILQHVLNLKKTQARADLLTYLYSQGVESIKDKEGKTLFQIAANRNDQKMQAYLEKVLQLENIAFGKREWTRYFGDIGKEPSLPPAIEEYLDSPCPIWGREEKSVKDTHLLVFIPEKVNGKPLTLNYLQELVRNPKGQGNKTEYTYYDSDVKKELGSQPSNSFYWILMTKDVLPNTRNKPYEMQLAELNTLAARAPEIKGLGEYQTPKALEAATSILMEYVRSGVRLYSDPEGSSKQWTWTRCEETVTVDKTQYRVAVGGFAASGLYVITSYWVSENIGLGGLRKWLGS